MKRILKAGDIVSGEYKSAFVLKIETIENHDDGYGEVTKVLTDEDLPKVDEFLKYAEHNNGVKNAPYFEELFSKIWPREKEMRSIFQDYYDHVIFYYDENRVQHYADIVDSE